jgi:biotin carboxyl carrier protein
MKRHIKEVVEVDGVPMRLEFIDEQSVVVNSMRYEISYLEKNKHLFSLIVNGTTYDGAFQLLPDETYSVMISHKNYKTKIIDERESIYKKYKKDTDEKKNIVMRVPMPGLITKIFIRVGDKISVGTRVCVLEAMKMENDIKATESGEVSQIFICENSIVEKGETIISIR